MLKSKKKIIQSKAWTLSRFTLFAGIIITLFALSVAGCSGTVSPEDDVHSGQEFSIDLETTDDQIRANLIVSNLGDSEFPGDSDFEGMARLYDQVGEEANFLADTYYLAAIGPEDSRVVTSLNWSLDPGIYFLTWGEPEYGGVISIFVLENMLSGTPEVVRSFSFQTEAANYGPNISNAGMIKSFSQAEDGSITITGETPIPDQNCVFPLLYSREGLVESFPAGECVQVAEGQWLLEVTAPPGSGGIQLEEDQSYQIIVFNDDLNIAPSEPFEVLISPPVQE
jgi:hypothetical protein